MLQKVRYAVIKQKQKREGKVNCKKKKKKASIKRLDVMFMTFWLK